MRHLSFAQALLAQAAPPAGRWAERWHQLESIISARFGPWVQIQVFPGVTWLQLLSVMVVLFGTLVAGALLRIKARRELAKPSGYRRSGAWRDKRSRERRRSLLVQADAARSLPAIGAFALGLGRLLRAAHSDFPLSLERRPDSARAELGQVHRSGAGRLLVSLPHDQCG